MVLSILTLIQLYHITFKKENGNNQGNLTTDSLALDRGGGKTVKERN